MAIMVLIAKEKKERGSVEREGEKEKERERKEGNVGFKEQRKGCVKKRFQKSEKNNW